jgi:Rrf2 family protein
VKLTSRSEYALLALISLARHKSEEYVSGETIAREQDIPITFLQQIMLVLKTARLVQSQKGPRGGYRLGRPAEQISLAEVIRLFEGALAATESASSHFYESTPIEKEPAILRIFREIRDYVSERLEKTSIADVR